MHTSLSYFVSAPRGTEYLLAGELRSLDASDIRETHAGVTCCGPLELGYRICLWSRVAGRILLPLAEFPAEHPDDLYRGALSIRWDDHLFPEGTFAVDFSGGSPFITDTRFGALRVKDAVADQFRERCGIRPSVARERPDLRIAVRLHRGTAVISLDLSGESLHRRGYRTEKGEAPLKENLAAAILIRAGWPELARNGAPFLDPMCGSGTLPIEAALIATECAPGIFRDYFGFLGWKGHDAGLWERLQEEARQQCAASANRPIAIAGYDRDEAVLRTARGNAGRAGLGDRIRFERREIGTARPFAEGGPAGLVAVNPPYGERLGQGEDLARLYIRLGEVLKREFRGWGAALLTAREGHHPVGLKPRKVTTLYNGALECTLSLFDIAVVDTSGQRKHPALPVLSPGAESFANRLRKNLRNLGKWAAQENITCYRLYDADLPEYKVALDIYGGETLFAHVQEYEAPSTINQADADRRLREALEVISGVLEIPRDRIFVKVRRRQRGTSQYTRMAASGTFHQVTEGSCRFWVNFADYLDTGLFLDHRPTRELLQDLAAGRKFLNLFGYTGAATVHAAAGGATATTTVDLSSTYLDWARRNLELNGFGGRDHELMRADCREWLEKRVREGRRRWGLIFLDPPVFSNSKRMAGSFDVQRDHPALISLASELLEPDGILIFSTNLRGFAMDSESLSGLMLEDITRATIPPDYARNPRIHSCWRIRRPVRAF